MKGMEDNPFYVFISNTMFQEENNFMGKGDKRTKRGKIHNKSYGVKRPRKRKKKAEEKEK